MLRSSVMRRASATRTALLVATLAALVAATPPARADEAATADALFREGRKAMARGDWADAAARLRESQRLEPAAGTLLNLAIAEEKLGMLAAAWEHARGVMDQVPPSDDRHRLARELHESLDRRVPRLVLRPAGALPTGARVRLDGVELRAASFGVPLPLDPGAHSVVVEAPGHLERVASLELAPGRTLEHALEPGARVAGTAAPAPVGDRPADRGGSRSPLRAVGFAAAGVGAASLAVGGVTGYLAIRKNDTVESHCEPRGCDAMGVEAADAGKTFATVSTVTVIGGAALLVGGALLVWLAPRAPASARAAFEGVRF